MTYHKPDEKPQRWYFGPIENGRRTTSHNIQGKTIALVEGSPVDHEDDPEKILSAMGILPSDENLNHYFPRRTRDGKRCPTLFLIESARPLNPHDPIHGEIAHQTERSEV